MKKYFLTMVVMAVFVIGFTASDNSETAAKLVGKYQVVDSKGNTWYFNITDDRGVTVKSSGMSDDDMYYGEWLVDGPEGSICRLFFSDFHAGNPQIAFPNGEVWPRGEIMLISNDWFLYRESENLKAKNPNARLKMVKQ